MAPKTAQDRSVEPAPYHRHESARGVHGETCVKAPHVNSLGGYLHAADDDRPYDVDGVRYCGRCQWAL
jgi:hypothetical protein